MTSAEPAGISRVSFLDSLPEAQQDVYRAQVMAAVQDHADACAERDALAAAQGPRAAALAAYYDGHPLGTVEAIEARYRGLQDETRGKKDVA